MGARAIWAANSLGVSPSRALVQNERRASQIELQGMPIEFLTSRIDPTAL
jgi:hypothetical protein